MICTNCGKIIPESVIQKRHYTKEHLAEMTVVFCDKKCRGIYDLKNNFFHDMSAKGAKKRHDALIVSNKVNPRRRQK
jgi:hypothetical protein